MAIGVMGAMTEEIHELVAELGSAVEVAEAGGRRYYRGKLWGHPVVLVFSRWGKVAAATTAACLITQHGVSSIVFTGVAGSADESIRIGDVVVATDLYQHDMDATPLFPRHEIPLLGVGAFSTDRGLRDGLTVAARAYLDRDLAAEVPVEIRASFGIRVPRVVEAAVASGDKFFADKHELAAVKDRLPAIGCVEMEGGAVAQVCHEYRTPFAVVRTISDAADEAAHVDFPKFITAVASRYSHGILRHFFQNRPGPA